MQDSIVKYLYKSWIEDTGNYPELCQQQLIIEEIAIANKVQRSFVWTGHENNSWGACKQQNMVSYVILCLLNSDGLFNLMVSW